MKLYQKENGSSISYDVTVTFEKNVEIIVVGLGCSGSFSAISAAQEGASVLGIERTNGVGGMSTLGSVTDYYYGFAGGMFEQVDAESVADRDVFAKFGYHPDAKQYNIERRLKENRVDTLFSSVVLGVYFEGNRAVGVKALTPDGILSIGCKLLIDATSDGHIISMCPVTTTLGRDTDGKTVPFTSMMAFIDRDGSYHTVNRDSGYCNQYNAYEFSRRIIEAHSHNTFILKDDGRKMLYVASKIGVREGIRFEGEEKLSLSDVLEDRETDKTLFYAYSDVDKHGHDTAVDTEIYQDWWVISNLATVTVKIPLPLGAIVPKGLKGILSNGRCLSVDGYVSAAIRMNRDMYRLGEAEGVAAAMSVLTGKDVLEIEYPKLQENLIKRGCFDPSPDKKFGFDYPGKDKPYRKVEWFTEFEEIKSGLSTETPGVAIWSCRKLGDSIADDLVKTMEKADHELLQYNCAIALGMIGDRRALPVLRQIAVNRSSFYFKDCRRSNQFRSVIAICLLGRLLDSDSIDLLTEIVFSEEEIQKSLYHELAPNYLYYNAQGSNFVYFQHFSHAAMALVKIAKGNPKLTADLKERFTKLFSDEAYIRKVTPKNNDTSEYREIRDVAEYILKLLG
jgi:hypothetical protein